MLWSHRILQMRTGIGWGGGWSQRRILTQSFFGALRGSDSTTFLVLWKAFGVWRPHIKCPLFGQLHGGRFLQVIIWEGVFQLWIGVVYAGVVGSVDHLLLHCGEVSWLWSLALRLFGVAWVLPKKIIDLLAGWKNWLGSSVRIFGIWYHIVWCGLFGGSAIVIFLRTWSLTGISF